MKKFVKSAFALSLAVAMAWPSTAFAAEYEDTPIPARNREIVPTIVTTVKGGLTRETTKETTATVSTIFEDGVTYYSISDIAESSKASSPEDWKVRDSQYSKLWINKQLVPAECLEIKMSDGTMYELGAHFLFRVENDGIVSADGSIAFFEEDGEIYATIDCVNALFSSCARIYDNAVYIFNRDKAMSITDKITKKHVKQLAESALFDLYVMDPEGYKYVVENCKNIKTCTQEAANKAGNASGDVEVGGYVKDSDRNTMVLSETFLEYTSLDTVAAMMVHEANHCDTSTKMSEETAVVAEIQSMLRMGKSKTEVQKKIDSYAGMAAYADGAKVAQEILDAFVF